MRMLLALAFTVLLLSLTACALSNDVDHRIDLWPGKAQTQVTAFVAGMEEKTLTNNQLRLGEEDSLFLEREGTELVLRWRDPGWAGVRFSGGDHMQLGDVHRGYLELTLEVEDVSSAGLEISLLGAGGRERSLTIDRQLQPLAGQGRQTVHLPLACLLRESDDVGDFFARLRLTLGGRGQMTLSNASIGSGAAKGALTLICPDSATLAITPAPLDAQWARSWWLPRHRHKLVEAAASDPQIVFLGDSITQGWEAGGNDAFAQHFGQWRTLNLGFGGDRTENVLWRLQHGAVDAISPELVVLMIGTNNTGHRQDEPAHTAAGIEKILQELRARLPESRILLLAVFPRGAEADNLLRRINDDINQRIRHFADNEYVFFADLNAVLLDAQGRLPEAIMPDLLHPNALGYERIASALAPRIRAVVGDP